MRSETEAAPIAPPRPGSESFEDFFAEYYERLLRALFLVTGNRHESEELAQEASLRVYERWDKLLEAGNPAGYAYRTALNLRRSRMRRLASAARRTFRRE